jgi:hypothetical protein
MLGAFLSGAVQAGPGALLGINLDHPQFNFTSVTGQGASYDGTNLTITSTPVFTTFTSGGTAEFTIGGSLTMTVPIDAAGMIGAGGTFSVSGIVTDTATSNSYSGVLLSGTVTDYGILDIGGPGGTDIADFTMTATGGSMKSLFDAVSSTVGAIITLEGSGYSGSFAGNWAALRAKGDMGPVPVITPAPPVTIGYWKNHPEDWPVTDLTICGQLLDQDELLSILSTPVRGDKTISMAHQLIAAMLNEYNGNLCSSIDDAESWLCSHGGIAASRKQWDGGESLKDTLDIFNNGGGC